MADKCQTCEPEPSKEDAQYEAFKRKNEEAKAIASTLDHIKNKIVVLSGKGGVGKSTVATNLAFALASEGHSVGIMDADITGPDIPKMMGLEGQKATVTNEETVNPVVGPHGIKVMSMSFLLQKSDQAIVWRGPMKMGIIKEFFTHVKWGDLDYLIVDLPPGTSDEPLSIAQYLKDCNGAVVVTTPQDVSLLDIAKAVSFTRLLKMPILGLVENMSGFKCPHCGEVVDIFKKGSSETAAKEMGIDFLGSIPIDPGITTNADEGSSFLTKAPDSDSAKAFMGIVERVKKASDEVCKVE